MVEEYGKLMISGGDARIMFEKIWGVGEFLGN
jgi:hypothetical protein